MGIQCINKSGMLVTKSGIETLVESDVILKLPRSKVTSGISLIKCAV